MHLLTTVTWYSTWSSIVSELRNHTNAARRPQRAIMQTVLCKRPPTAPNLYRGRNNCCTTHAAKATYYMFSGHDYIFIVEQASDQCQLIDILDSLLAASICCQRGRHRCNAVIHASIQPTRGLCLKANLNFCVRPFEGRLRIAFNYFSHRFFSDNRFLRFSKFSDQLLCQKLFLRKRKYRKRFFLSHNLEFVVIIRKKGFDGFFLIYLV